MSNIVGAIRRYQRGLEVEVNIPEVKLVGQSLSTVSGR